LWTLLGLKTIKFVHIQIFVHETNEDQITGNDASRMAESAAINRSLSVLGQVVHSLNQGAVRSQLLSRFTDFITVVSALVADTLQRFEAHKNIAGCFGRDFSRTLDH
jgi:hypothetical protein